ncbi:MAG: hypothetical protein AABX54_02775 [Nanoarchaeota archaeon]
MAKFRYETFASAGPSPEQLKKPVDRKHSREIISYNGNVYAIRYLELRNLGLDYHDEIVTMCRERGLEDPAFFGRACMYCGNATTNLDDIVEMSNGPIIFESMPKVNCTYQPDKEIRVATTFSSRKRKQKPFYAIDKRCVFDDSLITYLADNGLLKPYEVSIDFNFRPITDFKKDDKIPCEYLMKNVERRLPVEGSSRKGLLGILKRIFRR